MKFESRGIFFTLIICIVTTASGSAQESPPWDKLAGRYVLSSVDGKQSNSVELQISGVRADGSGFLEKFTSLDGDHPGQASCYVKPLPPTLNEMPYSSGPIPLKSGYAGMLQQICTSKSGSIDPPLDTPQAFQIEIFDGAVLKLDFQNAFASWTVTYHKERNG